MANAVQTKRQVKGLSFVIMGAAVGGVMLLTSLVDNSWPIAAAIGTPLFLAAIIDLGWSEFKQASQENSAGLTNASTSEKFFTHLAIVQLVFVSLFTTAFLGLFGYLIISSTDVVAMSTATYVQLGTYLAYAFILGRVIRQIMPWLRSYAVMPNSSWMSSISGPSYEITPDGFEIDLKISVIGQGREVPKIKFTFAEITDLQALSYRAAEAYLESQTGLSAIQKAKMSVSSITEMYTFLQGKTERPRYFFKLQSFGQCLIIKGENFLYAITVNKDDCSDLLQAYAASRQPNTATADGASAF